MQDCQLVGKRVEQDANRTGSHRVRTPSKALGGLYLKGWAVNQLSLFNISVTHMWKQRDWPLAEACTELFLPPCTSHPQKPLFGGSLLSTLNVSSPG